MQTLAQCTHDVGFLNLSKLFHKNKKTRRQVESTSKWDNAQSPSTALRRSIELQQTLDLFRIQCAAHLSLLRSFTVFLFDSFADLFIMFLGIGIIGKREKHSRHLHLVGASFYLCRFYTRQNYALRKRKGQVLFGISIPVIITSFPFEESNASICFNKFNGRLAGVMTK